jgi:hypothetical protein
MKHIGPLATASLSDIKQVAVAFKTATDYYAAEDYKDDNGAKGRQIHLEFHKLAKQFYTDFDQFEKALDEVENLQSEEELKKFAKQSSYSYWFRFFNLQAKRMLDAKPATYQAAFAKVDKAHKDMEAFLTGRSQPNEVFTTYKEAADSYINIGKRIQRGLNSVEKPADLQSMRNELTTSYNHLVTMADSLRTLEGVGQLN